MGAMGPGWELRPQVSSHCGEQQELLATRNKKLLGTSASLLGAKGLTSSNKKLVDALCY